MITWLTRLDVYGEIRRRLLDTAQLIQQPHHSLILFDMTCTEEHHRTPPPPASAITDAAWVLLLLPGFLFNLIRLTFAYMTQDLRANRDKLVLAHQHDWRKHLPALVSAEAGVWDLLFYGARVVLRGDVLDVANIPFDPERRGFYTPAPRSAREVQMRIETVTRILADPEPYIRRLAARMARTALAARRDRPPVLRVANLACAKACSYSAFHDFNPWTSADMDPCPPPD